MPLPSRKIVKEVLGGRSWETELLSPLVGESMLELGNKKKGDVLYKRVFTRLGMRHVSVDLNGKDGALAKDLREPLELGTFDMVTNFGTTEHVSPDKAAGQAAVWRNILEAMHVDAVLVSITPRPGAERWKTHGAWYPTVAFFECLAECNGLEVERCYTDESLVYARLRRVEDRPFRMPDRGMHHNADWRQGGDNIC